MTLTTAVARMPSSSGRYFMLQSGGTGAQPSIAKFQASRNRCMNAGKFRLGPGSTSRYCVGPLRFQPNSCLADNLAPSLSLGRDEGGKGLGRTERQHGALLFEALTGPGRRERRLGGAVQARH